MCEPLPTNHMIYHLRVGSRGTSMKRYGAKCTQAIRMALPKPFKRSSSPLLNPNRQPRVKMAQYTTVLGMDLLAFFLAVVSCLGLAVSTFIFLRTYTPTNLYLYAADSVAQTRALYERLESADFFSSEAHRVNHLGSHLDK